MSECTSTMGNLDTQLRTLTLKLKIFEENIFFCTLGTGSFYWVILLGHFTGSFYWVILLGHFT